MQIKCLSAAGHERHMQISLYLDFAEIREGINIRCFFECWRLVVEQLYIKGFSIHTINSVDETSSTQNLHKAMALF